MMPQKRPFQLPMAITIAKSKDEQTGAVTMHSLDFDIACVCSTEEEATKKIRIAIKNYVEFGLSNGWEEDISYPAPEEYWQNLEGAEIVVLGEPIQIMTRKMLVYRATPRHEVHNPRRSACPA